MMNITNENFIVALVAFFLGIVVSFLIWHREKDEDEKEVVTDKPLVKIPIQDKHVQVLFFPDRAYPCTTFYNHLKRRTHGNCNKNRCEYIHRNDDEWTSFMKLLDVLNEARSHIDICVYLFTQQFLFEFIVFLHKERKLRVRIITDSKDDESKKNMNKIVQLQAAGIEVKTSSAKMHHKFVIIDNKKLVHGSFNWTKTAILDNHESLIITMNPRVVREFVGHFRKMWQEFHYWLSVDKASAKSPGPTIINIPSHGDDK